ncbi:MAG: ABC-F family ATP-binding cassette domain-containing protein [Bacteroidales bacterium]|nr:ABC-F family ATP-binding cassette domain-containing protein [Bacteroidales bacterium]MDD4217999.1 ABC-F family ATP-binding cassette domain-containing protein [Bacteroidales bacterium]MDY0143194.1 ABC-F family ATP-binding cassette domain-containing protein [Bacteroidales bacterium]
MISINNLCVRFGGFELFTNLGFMINSRDRIGLVGKNGAGKSTLLKIIYGEISPSEGSISGSSDIQIGYLPQQMKVSSENITVLEDAKSAFKDITTLEAKLEKVNHKLSVLTNYESEEYLELIEQISTLNERLALFGTDNIVSETEKILKGLGFLQSDFERKVTEFSGGWRMRIELAKILLQNPEIILLDEPTNHLDIEAIQWLEEFLSQYKGAVLLISHDRAFLDNVTNRTLEINAGTLYDYKVPYSKFKVLQEERIQQQLAAYDNQQKIINDTEKFIERFRYKATKANQVQSRIKHLGKLELVDIDDLDNASINIRFPSAPRAGDVVVETKELSKSYGKHTVLNKIDFVIERGEKIAFIGRNGEGKTTLSRIFVGDLPYDEGVLKIGHNVKIGYFAQNQDELLDPNLTVFETLDKVAVGDVRTKIRDILGSFLFSGEDIDKKVKVLSGGEHSRLSLAKLLLEPYNLLVLDEPTNHLDIRSKDLLKQALLKYNGTLILVSHDRYFLDGLIDKVYEFRDKKIKQHIGGIYDFIRRRKIENIQDIEIKDKQLKQQSNKNISDNKQLYLERKEQDKKRRSLEKAVHKHEQQIEKFETEIEGLNKLLSAPDKHDEKKLATTYQMFTKINTQLEKEMSAWEKASLDLETFIKELDNNE